MQLNIKGKTLTYNLTSEEIEISKETDEKKTIRNYNYCEGANVCLEIVLSPFIIIFYFIKVLLSIRMMISMRCHLRFQSFSKLSPSRFILALLLISFKEILVNFRNDEMMK